MDYYKLRKLVATKTLDWLETVAAAKKAGHDLPPFADFQRKMICEYGVSEKMLRRAVELLAPGATVRDSELVLK